MPDMTSDTIERLGELADSCDYYLALDIPFMPKSLLLDGMKTGLKEVRDALREIYIEATGDNPWEGNTDG